MLIEKYEKSRKVLSNHGNKIEFRFIVVIVLLIILSGALIYVTASKPVSISKTPNAVADVNQQTKKQIEQKNFEDDVITTTYMNFWQKFNTTAVIVSNKSKDHIVTQNEVERFKLSFLNDFGLTEKDQLVYNYQLKLVPTKVLFCYLKMYDPKLPPPLTIEDIKKVCYLPGYSSG